MATPEDLAELEHQTALAARLKPLPPLTKDEQRILEQGPPQVAARSIQDAPKTPAIRVVSGGAPTLGKRR